MNGKKVLITGVSGFAGSFLAEELLSTNNFQISGTYHSRKPSIFDGKDVNCLQANLNDKHAVDELIKKTSPDIVFHLAALTSPAESFDDPEKTLTNNILTQVNLLEALRKNEIHARIFIISSSDVYGMVSPSDVPVDEETPFRPGNPYAVSKITQDYLGLQYFLAYKMDIVRIRPFNHIGPRQEPKFAVASFAKQIAEIEKGLKEPVMKVGNLDAQKDFTDVRDMVKAYTLLIEKGKSGEVYNVGSGKAYKIQDLLDKLIELSNTPIRVEQDPNLFRPSDTLVLQSDNTKIKNDTGWSPHYTIDETLKSILDYWRSVV